MKESAFEQDINNKPSKDFYVDQFLKRVDSKNILRGDIFTFSEKDSGKGVQKVTQSFPGMDSNKTEGPSSQPVNGFIVAEKRLHLVRSCHS
ncbi:hypothetical protein CDAR_37911 [Caerostris darwini]|uniref:Uncharacterized protein n=1 Tax=Caerostris darwini TaxID=1538125 RepID=A0AAV4T5F0_9ARAC|nr:hypothetical protein CDAR_37911 [Caerostris darwini]